jgi:DNA polymerase II small subunit/DNA polymerase delta subunit B
MKDRSIVVISDMHVGSVFGLMPEGYRNMNKKTGESSYVSLSDSQKTLYDHWLSMCQNAQRVKPEAIIINGDVIDGTHRKNEGRNVILTSPKDQIDASVELLSKLPKSIPKFFTQGTSYHVDGVQPAEEYIADEFNAEFGPDLLVEKAGLRCHCAHWTNSSSSSWQYWTTPIARDSMLLSLNKAEDKYGPVDLAIRSHRHTYTYVDFTSSGGVITPCWQMRTEFAALKNIITPPEVGYLVIHNMGTSDNGKKSIWIDKSGFIKNPLPVVRKVGDV